MLDLLIRGGLVVTSDHEAVRDVGVQGGRIAYVAERGGAEVEAATVIDATNMLVLPGGVEAHAHIAEPAHRGWTRGEEVWLQSPEAATRAAAFGGTTTVASFAFMGVHARAEFHPVRAVEDRTEVFSGHAYTDYTFHPALVGNVGPNVVGALGEAIEAGIPTFKAFTTCVTTAQKGVKMDAGPMLEVFRALAAGGGMLLVHAEDDELVTYMESQLKAEGRDQWYNLHLVHSSLSEDIAFRRVLRLAREAAAAVYFVHVTGAAGATAIEEARRSGSPAYGEVLHNYLCFTADDYRSPDGGKVQTYPALKTEADREALWGALAAGTIGVVATDEYTTSYAVKTAGRTVETACGGHAGIETRGIIAYSEGVATGPAVPAPVRRRLRHQSGTAPRPVPAQGHDRPGKRRRHRHLGPVRRRRRSASTIFTTTATTASGRAGPCAAGPLRRSSAVRSLSTRAVSSAVRSWANGCHGASTRPSSMAQPSEREEPVR